MVAPYPRLAHLYLTGDQSLELENTVWDDLRVSPSFVKKGTADPTYVAVQAGLLPEFAQGDELFFTTQLPHTYKLGTDLKLHLHWTPHSRGTAENGKTVDWQVDLSTAPINGTVSSSATYDLADTCDGTNNKHQLVSSVTVTGSTFTLSTVLIGRVYRHTSDTWSTNTNGNKPALLEVDFHFEIDTLGSRAETSK